MGTPITIRIGEDQSWTSAITDSNKNPIADLSAYNFAMQVRSSIGALLLDLSTTNGKIVRGNGEITITVTAADTAGITDLLGEYDLKITDPFGKSRYSEDSPGLVSFEQSVTV